MCTVMFIQKTQTNCVLANEDSLYVLLHINPNLLTRQVRTIRSYSQIRTIGSYSQIHHLQKIRYKNRPKKIARLRPSTPPRWMPDVWPQWYWITMNVHIDREREREKEKTSVPYSNAANTRQAFSLYFHWLLTGGLHRVIRSKTMSRWNINRILLTWIFPTNTRKPIASAMKCLLTLIFWVCMFSFCTPDSV